MTNRHRLYRTHAVVLRRRDYLDADRILTLFTPSQGKLEVIAKGVRKTTSRKAGHLELFTHAQLLVAQARTWDIVTEAATVENFRYMREDLEKISRASYVCELVDAFSEAEDENFPMWELLLFTLRAIDEHGLTAHFDTHVLLRWFELHLMSLTGFEPQLFSCLACEVQITPVRNYLSLAEGGVLCPKCGANYSGAEELEVDVLKVMRFLQSRPWDEVVQLTVRPHVMRQVDNLLYRYLLTLLERQLKSTDFMRRLQFVMPQAPAPAISQPLPSGQELPLQEEPHAHP
jgi:DNA repair protein RecO (recombination protein O)